MTMNATATSGGTKYGYLKVTTAIRPEQPLAGQRLTASVRIENHFDKQVHIKEIRAVMPGGLKKIEEKKKKQKVEIPEDANRPSKHPGFFQRLIPNLNTSSDDELLLFRSGYSPLDEDKSISAPCLQSGDSYVENIYFRTRASILALPGTYYLDVTVFYMVDNQEHIETVLINFQIRPPLMAVVIGAVIGGIVGDILRELHSDPLSLDTNSVIRFLIAIVLSGVGVIFFTRKSGFQPLPVSIEDFWGGLLAGFFVGYLGSAYFTNILTVGAEATTAANATLSPSIP